MTPTILLVEDEDNDVFLLKRALSSVGLKNPLHVATHGGEALDYLQGKGKYADRTAFPVPYLILLDLKLPHTPGLEILKWLRQQPQFKFTVVIVLTSSTDASDVDSAYALGANGYLVKPADSDELRAIAQSIKDFWFTRNRPASTFTQPL